MHEGTILANNVEGGGLRISFVLMAGMIQSSSD